MIEKEIIIGKLTDIFRSIFRNDQIVLADGLTSLDVENWDSLSHMLMITEVEKTFSVKFSLREVNQLKNVGELIGFIESKLSV